MPSERPRPFQTASARTKPAGADGDAPVRHFPNTSLYNKEYLKNEDIRKTDESSRQTDDEVRKIP